MIVRSTMAADENRNFVPDDLGNYKVVREGNLVINKMKAWQGSLGIADRDGIVSPAYFVYDFRLADRGFGHVLLRSRPYVNLLRQMSDGVRVGQWDLSADGLKRIPVVVPPVEEQSQIVDFLDQATRRINRLIRAKRRLIELLNEQKQAIIHRAVTRGLDPDVRLKPSGIEWLGDVPEHWEVRRLKSLSIVKRGASPRPIDDPRYFDEHGEYAWVRIADVTASTRYLERTSQRLSESGKSLSVPIEPGGLFLSIAGSVGKAIITKIRCCIHDGFVYFSHFNGNSEFLFYVLSSNRIYGGLGKLGTQLNLNTETVGNIVMGWPPAEEQQRIVQHLDGSLRLLDEADRRASRAIELLREYRTRLIADVVTGKLDVRGIELPPLDDDAPLGEIDAPDDGDAEEPLEAGEDGDGAD